MTFSARFRRADRIVESRDYARIQRRGRRFSSKHFAVSIAPVRGIPSPGAGIKHPSNIRLGLSVSRRVGNAVERNRVKRAVREWFRTSRDALPAEIDIVVIARRGAADRGSRETAAELSELFATSKITLEKASRAAGGAPSISRPGP